MSSNCNGIQSVTKHEGEECEIKCSPHIEPVLDVKSPCCEPNNKDLKFTDNMECGVKQGFDGPRKAINDGKSYMDSTNREQGIVTLDYYDGCCSWKDIQYLQPLDIDNFFEKPRQEYDNYNHSRLKLKLLRDIYTHARKSIHDFILGVQEMETRVQNDMTPSELQSLELDYISNMNNMMKDFKNACTRLFDYETNDRPAIITTGERHLIDLRMIETTNSTKISAEWNVDTETLVGFDIGTDGNPVDRLVYTSKGSTIDKFPITRSNEVDVEYSDGDNYELNVPMFYIPGFSFLVNKWTSQCMLSINEPRHHVGNGIQTGRRINADYNYVYTLSGNVRSYQVAADNKVTGNLPYSFSTPDMARNLINDMTMYLYNTSQVTQNHWNNSDISQSLDTTDGTAGTFYDTTALRQYSNPRGAELHIEKLLQNVLRADRQIVQGDIIRKLPVVEAYASNYYGKRNGKDDKKCN